MSPRRCPLTYEPLAADEERYSATGLRRLSPHLDRLDPLILIGGHHADDRVVLGSAAVVVVGSLIQLVFGPDLVWRIDRWVSRREFKRLTRGEAVAPAAQPFLPLDLGLDEAGPEMQDDRIVDDHFQLDLSAKLKLTDNVQLFYEWVNINNAKYYAFNTIGGRRNLLQYEEYNWTMKFGAKVNF